MITEIIRLLAGLVLLYIGAEWLVRGGVRIASRCGISPLVIGLTLVAFATSAPELVVSVEAAWNGQGDISVGNVVGSNICNIALILGLSALITPLQVKTQLLRFDGPLLLVLTLGFAAMGYGIGGLNRWCGGILFCGLIAYTVWNIYAARRESDNEQLQQECEDEIAGLGRRLKSWPSCILLVVVGLGALVIGGRLLVDGAVAFGRFFGISEAVIALTVVAVGTSLPELATSVVAACRRQQDIAIGNVVGSNIFNILGIMGLSPLIRPVQSAGIHPVDWGMLVAVTVLLLPFMLSNLTLSRREGAVLLLIYLGYTVWLIGF